MTSSGQAGCDFDIVIAGGGLVGGSLAIALSPLPVRVALVEAVQPEDAEQPSFDDRTIALSHGSCRILRSIGIWDRLARSQTIWPIRQIHISEQGRFGTALIDSDEQGVSELGYVIRSHELGQAIWHHLRNEANIELICPARVSATTAESAVRRVALDGTDGHRAVSTALLVAADGARSELRDQLGIDAEYRDYEQIAIVANVQIDPRKNSNIAYERFTPDGPLALLPGPAGRCTVVMARSTAAAQDVLQRDDQQFVTLLQDAFGYRLGKFFDVSARSAYPLGLSVASRLAASRAVLVGSSAHGLHPVAAQGFNLGLRDVACLAELVADAGAVGSAAVDFGSSKILQSYADWRQTDQRKVVQFTDNLIRGFGSRRRGVADLRGLALAGFDMLPGAKQLLARQTMGLDGRLSRLARGLPL